MSRAAITILGTADRNLALRWIEQVPHGTRIEFKASKRTTDQNSRMWAMLTDVARQVTWYGQKLRASDWKLIFIDALKRELRIVPNIDGCGYVNLGQSSSDLSKQEMTDLIELIFKFGAEHNVVFHDPTDQEKKYA